jgi:hypothetical protein
VGRSFQSADTREHQATEGVNARRIGRSDDASAVDGAISGTSTERRKSIFG